MRLVSAGELPAYRQDDSYGRS